MGSILRGSEIVIERRSLPIAKTTDIASHPFP
jgi:hypothetical protein